MSNWIGWKCNQDQEEYIKMCTYTFKITVTQPLLIDDVNKTD